MITPWIYFTGDYVTCSLVIGDLLDEDPSLPIELEETPDPLTFHVTIYFKEDSHGHDVLVHG